MQIIAEADNYTKFINAINEIKVQIVKRREGRKQNELELWVIQRYLTKVISKDGDHYKLVKRESPDFELEINGSIKGIEITESTCEQYQQLLSYIDKQSDLTIEMDHFRYGHKFTKNELFRLAKPMGTKLNGPGWGGLQAEVFAAKWARDAALKKIRKMKQWEYINESRVLLYDNSPTTCKNDIEFERILRNVFNDESELSHKKIDLLTSNGSKVIYEICEQT